MLRVAWVAAFAFAAGLTVGWGWFAAPPAECPPCPGWPLWDAYAERFVQDDGRVIEYKAGARSTSEGQAYALFFALVANDKVRFRRILAWTKDNLAAGDLTARLPAWLWGEGDNGVWGVLDANPASDADLWLAYALLEAGRLWSDSRYDSLGRLVLEQVARREVAQLPGLGPMLLPAPDGFQPEDTLWRLNPSYLPVPLLRALAGYDPTGPWTGMADRVPAVVRGGGGHGFAADWVAYRGGQGFEPDPVNGATGGFDAIRTYLWAGVLDPGDPVAAELLKTLGGMVSYLADHPVPPARVDIRTGEAEGDGPLGFSAAVLPYLKATAQGDLLERQRRRLSAVVKDGELYGETPAYYDQNLILFGVGWLEGRYRFNKDGQLIPHWMK